MKLTTNGTNGEISQFCKGNDLPSFKISCLFLMTSAMALVLGASAVQAQIPAEQTAAGTNQPLNLAKNSPFRDPDIIYLEADQLINDEAGQILTAVGEVEGRYQDRTLRADEVVYYLETGEVFASGNVILIDATGATQYATRIELSSELETGTATNFTARFPEGGMTGAALATRTSAEEVELYNAYYTACEACVKDDGSVGKPTWRIKARKVSQDRKNAMIRYRDAVFEFKGIPLFYTPYLAHPDPSAGRRSGWLNPFGGLSSSKGINARIPYFWAIDDYSDLTITPRVYQKVNPLLELDYRRKFFSGELNIEGSLTYGSAFDRNGDPFDENDVFSNPAEALTGKKLRSHVFANGLFAPSENWSYGFGLQVASDDLHLNRYDLTERPARFGIYEADSRRLVSQAFIVGQDEDFRFSTSAYGFQSLRTSIREQNNGSFQISREDDGILPIIAPKIEVEKTVKDPLIGGQLTARGDVTLLTRKIGTDYTRASGGLEWTKNMIAPGGIEVKPFADVRADYFELDPENTAAMTFDKKDFSRTTGKVGVDIRYPFIRTGKDVDIIIEPRVQVTQSFGDGKLDNFDSNNDGTFDLLQDSIGIDLDQSLLWSSNKSTGYDFFQKGLRADAGASLIADWNTSRAHLFVGQSYSSNVTNEFAAPSGLNGKSSDIVGLFELDLNGKVISKTRLRYDDNDNKFRRIDTSLTLRNKFLEAKGRYYKFDNQSQLITGSPREELSGSVRVNLSHHWSTRYTAYHDLTSKVTRRQDLALVYDDDCTRIELIYNKNNFNSDAVRNTSGIGIKVSLLTLGDFSPD